MQGLRVKSQNQNKDLIAMIELEKEDQVERRSQEDHAIELAQIRGVVKTGIDM